MGFNIRHDFVSAHEQISNLLQSDGRPIFKGSDCIHVSANE